jgi:hypothetical protein
MKSLATLTVFLGLTLPLAASAQSTVTAPAAPAAPLAAPTAVVLNIAPKDRQFFQFGYTIAKASFAYAELAKQSGQISTTHDKMEQVRILGNLAPLALHDRALAYQGLTRAQGLLADLKAPPAAMLPVSQAIAKLSRPVVLTPDAQALSSLSPDAAHTLSSLNEFEKLSSLPEQEGLRHWLANGANASSGQVWYAEGLVSALAEIASAQHMPDLLPPATEIATDLRGLRDWLTLRLPDNPTPDQIVLKKKLDAFLLETGESRHHSKKTLTASELQTLGEISARLQAQILNTPPPAPPAVKPQDTTPPETDEKTPTG